MSKITVSFSDKIVVDGRAPWAACTIERDCDDDMLDRPAIVAEFVAQMYRQAENAVGLQLSRALPTERVAKSPLDRPRIAAMTQAEVDAPAAAPPPRPAVSTPTPSTAPPAGHPKTYRGQDGPPRSGKQLHAWAKKNGSLEFFTDLGRRQTPPLPGYFGDWSDEWTAWAVAEYGKKCIPPVPSTNGSGAPPY